MIYIYGAGVCGKSTFESSIFNQIKHTLQIACKTFHLLDLHYYNNERISLKLNGMSPVQYRAHSQNI